MPIQVLPQTLINQIAAGEVVVNMASVVKELVENAIDAGARNITVELSGDALDLVVSDDGCGMDREDAELCLQRHATSKIRTTDDLFHLMTRGFRGEALASIAAVSRMEIRTRRREDLSGSLVAVEGGLIDRMESVGCPAGTRIAIRDLFFNTPARKKFLKSSTGEANAVATMLTRQALAAWPVGIKFLRNDRVDMDFPSGQSLADRFLALMGSRIEHGLLELDYLQDRDRGGQHVFGYLAQPLSSRHDRRCEYLFVNGRPFSSRPITAAIEQACRGFIMIGRFPIFCLFIELDPAEVDINVHPTKEEVRFRNERAVASAAYHAARIALEGAGFVPEMHLAGRSGASAPAPAAPQPEGQSPESPPPNSTAPRPAPPGPSYQPAFFQSPEALVAKAFDRKRARDVQTDLTVELAKSEWKMAEQDRQRRERIAPTAAAPGEQPEATGFWDRPYAPEPLGQIDETFLVVRYGPDLVLVDQHAAHERLRYLQLQRVEHDSHAQALLVPATLDVPPDRAAAMEALAQALAPAGFALEPFGGATWAINAVPGDLSASQAVEVIQDLLEDDDLPGDPSRLGPDHLEALREKWMIRAACHSSIRAGQRLTREEMDELLLQMRSERLSFTCPHGRPTIICLSRHELDRSFKRTH
ncbi:MAG: DNA mismatch repair endonuclease MutL [Sumerlaeia bacterium]